MKISAADVAKALEAMNWVITHQDSELPDGLKYTELLNARVNFRAILTVLNVEVKID